MSIKIMQQVWEQAPVTGGTLLVLLALADSADDNLRSCFPGIESLAHKARLSERQVKRAIAELVEAGVILVERNASPYKTNLYTLRPIETWPRSDNMSPTHDAADVTSATEGGDTHVTSDVTPMSPKPSVTSDEPSEDLFGSVEPQRSAREIVDDQFEAIWQAYPERPNPGSKKNARLKFNAAIKKMSFADLMLAVQAYAASRVGEDPKYTKCLEFWLNGELHVQWLETARTAQAARSSKPYRYVQGGIER